MEIFMFDDWWHTFDLAGLGAMGIIAAVVINKIKNRILYGSIQNSTYPRNVRCKCKKKWIVLKSVSGDLYHGFCTKCQSRWIYQISMNGCVWFRKEDWDKANQSFENKE